MIKTTSKSIAVFRCVMFIAVMISLIITNTTASHAQQNVAEVDASEIQSIMTDEPDTAPEEATPSGIDLLTLITRGGAFMIPIALMSLLVVALAVERAISLRRSKVMPSGLVRELRAMANPVDRFNPTIAIRACEESESPTARVVASMLMRTGQPLADVERAATDAIEREADRHAASIRWLTLAAAATPLMGLLGTVWGMIVAFHESTTLTADRSRSEQLSEGIYTALVTTMAGLAVAIPAAILALYLENRLSKLFYALEEFAFEIAPGLTRFAGRRRLNVEGKLEAIDHSLVNTDSMGTSDSTVTPPPPEGRGSKSKKSRTSETKAG